MNTFIKGLIDTGCAPVIITLVFITARLWGIINWEWYWILSPIIVTVFMYSLLILAGILGGIIYAIKDIYWKTK